MGTLTFANHCKQHRDSKVGLRIILKGKLIQNSSRTRAHRPSFYNNPPRLLSKNLQHNRELIQPTCYLCPHFWSLVLQIFVRIFNKSFSFLIGLEFKYEMLLHLLNQVSITLANQSYANEFKSQSKNDLTTSIF